MNIQSQQNHQLYALTGLGALKITGSEAPKLLQGQLSCDIDAISPENGAMGAHCNPQGRVISLFYLLQIASDYYLILPQTMLATALAALKKYALFYKVQLSEATDSVLITGSINGDWPAALASYSLPNSNRKILLFTSAQSITGSFLDWHNLDMQAGIPAIYPETSASFLPHDLNLPQLNAVNFNKGCFTGQEIIARMHYRGKPKKHLYRGLCADSLTPGEAIFISDKAIGTVIDCSQKVYNHKYAFVFVADEASIENGMLQTEHGQPITIQQSE